jgi:tRNA modification GTPase
MTIVACSSAPSVPPIHGAAAPRDLGRVIVRLSGPQAFAIASTVFVTQDEQPLTASGRAWSRVDGAIAWRGHRLAACAYRMRAPHSYTREHIVELHIPALPWVLADLLERLIAAGARAAEPGEFTRRAFENGRITLDQAQTIGALIQARSAEEARVHAARLAAHGHSRLANLRTGIEDLLSLVELGLDFSHEDVGVLSVEEMLDRLKRLRELSMELSGAEKSAEPLSTSELHTLLPRVALIGPVNAGKSSLFNRLLERDAAIVSPAAHTTRDVVEAPLSLSSGACVLCDTAGFASPLPRPLSCEERGERRRAFAITSTPPPLAGEGVGGRG